VPSTVAAELPYGFGAQLSTYSPLAEHYAAFSFFKVVYRPIGKVILNLFFKGLFNPFKVKFLP
jgi:hypothetical protein